MLFVSPAALAFFAGGYFDRPRLWAGIVVWICVATLACIGEQPWPRARAARLAIGGLAGLTLWTIVSIAWAPLRDAAQADAQRAVLYLGVLIAGTAALRQRGLARAAEPALALGALIVVCEGVSERVLPGVFTLSRDVGAGGRLSQPLTYWNAMGLFSAIGFVLLARLAGDHTRPPRLRVAATVAGPPVGLGLYLTLSRGGLLAAAIGLGLLALLAPTREQAKALIVMLMAAVPAVVGALVLSNVRTLQGSLGTREVDGVVVLCLLLVSMGAGAIATVACLRGEARAYALGLSDARIRGFAVAGCLVVALVTIGVFVAAATSRVSIDPTQSPTATSARLGSTETIRGNFWRVATSAFVDHPIRGVGAGGFETEWGRRRTIIYYARDAHSLYLETLCELGIVGGLALMALLAGVATCARRAYRRDPGLSAGWLAVASMWVVHAGLDWDWEMPAVSLLAFLVFAAILALADDRRSRPRASAAVAPAAEMAPLSAGVN